MNFETCQVWGGVWYPDVECTDIVCETNCGGTCSPGETIDCFGNCFPITWIGDGICDIGQYQWDTNSIYLNCEEFGFDGGDCSTNEIPLNVGACCIGSLDDCEGRVCENQFFSNCLVLGGQYLGENTICVDQACSCPPGLTADCNGNCFPIYYLNDEICHDGHWYPENGPDANEYQLNLSCLELACDVGDCVGICGGACCVGHSCIEDLSFVLCVDQGGTFLGGGETCAGVDCSNYLVPQILGTPLSGSQIPIVGDFGSTVASKNGVFVLSLVNATNSKSGNEVVACNVYRNTSVLSETLFVESIPSSEVFVATDGTRVVLSSGMDIHVFVDVSGSFVHEQTFAVTSEIKNVSISGNNIFVADLQSWSGEGVTWFRRSGKAWNEQALQFVGINVTKTAIDGINIAVLGLFGLEMYEFDGTAWTGAGNFNLNGTHQDVDIDNNSVLLGETTNSYPGTPSLAQATLIEKVNGIWVITEHLIPVDMDPDDEFAYSVSIENGLACISVPLNDSSVLNGGAIVVFREVNGIWTYTNKVVPSDAIPTMKLGSAIATNGTSVIATWQTEGPDLWTPGENGAQFITIPDFDWSNANGGSVLDPANWVPAMPSISDSVSIAIPAKFEIASAGALPFANVAVGPSKPTFILSGASTTLSGNVHVAGMPNYTGDLEINGALVIAGDVTVGGEFRPGALSVKADSIVEIQGAFSLHRNSQVHIELGVNGTTPLKLLGTATIEGSLIVSPPSGMFSPVIGESWILLDAQLGLSVENKFPVIVIPGIGSDKYFDLQYVTALNGTQLIATVQSVDNLYDLDDAGSVDVSGTASSIVVADIGSQSGPADGYDDIALTLSGVPGSVLIFVNDGAGSIQTQIMYPAGNNPTSIEAGTIDNDGTTDIIITNGDDDTFFVLFNVDEDLTSMIPSPPVSTGDFPIDLEIIDFDQDGDNDIVVACFGEDEILLDGSVPGELQFFDATNLFRTNFSLVGSIALERPAKITPGDVNHDKDLFISVSLNSAGKVARLRQIVPVGFNWAVVQYSTVGSNPTDIVSGDVDNDGDFDVVVANEGTNTVSILLMDIGGLFEDELVIEVGNEPSSVELLDYDGDSDLDLAIIATNDAGQRVVMVYRNDTSLNPNQNITFALEQELDEGLSPILLGSGELDGDAADDLVTIVTGPSFRGVPQLAIRSIPNSVCVGDIDQNNVIDVVDLLALISTWGTEAGDINGDGTTDVEDLLLLISGWGLCP